MTRKALSDGLGWPRQRIPIKRNQAGELSINRAADLAGVSIAESLEIAREQNLTTQRKPENLDTDVDAVREL